MIASFLIQLIRLYQKTLSPDHGPLRHRYAFGFCKFKPTCSEYAVEALKKHDLPSAITLTFKRVVRCQPWANPSYDPVP